MRLGGQVFDFITPEDWVRRHKALGFTAAFFPLGHDALSGQINEFKQAADENGILIAEVGAWSNPMSRDKSERAKAIALCIARLELAETIGARCCVNIAGSYGSRWDGPHPDHYTQAAFDDIVQTTQTIIDAVHPRHTKYSLETMPWTPPDSPEGYLALIEAIDRPGFGAHLDVCNMISSPRLAGDTQAFIHRCFDLLGPHIVSCHAKDVALAEQLTVHISEVLPGQGCLCYRTLIDRVTALPNDVPLLLEHLQGQAEVEEAVRYVRRYL